MARKEKDGWGGFIMGPIIVLAAMAALWKNEVRFDYHRAASRTNAIAAVDDQANDSLVSHTGDMDRSLTMAGEYVKKFTGYLTVKRKAEIYCWDRSEDSEGDVTWRKKWQSSVENNSRNRNISQRLRSREFLPTGYQVGALPVDVSQIDFVDSRIQLSAGQLELTGAGVTSALNPQGTYFSLSKGRSDRIGDERISYAAIPVPSTATYFGKLVNGKGVAYDDQKRTGFIAEMINDTGVLHYIVAGNRETALVTMKEHIKHLKWMVRGFGTAGVVVGFMTLFGSMARFLYQIPVIGWMAERGVIVLSILLGVPLAIVTILSAYLAGHPILLAVLVLSIVGILYYLLSKKKKAKTTQQAVREDLNEKHGRKLDLNDIKTMEFIELVHLAQKGSQLDSVERSFLYRWGKKNGWNKEKCDELIQQADEIRQTPEFDESTDAHLQSLIELALADGVLSPYEIRSIRQTATKVGYDRSTVDQLMQVVQETALNHQQAS